MQLGPKAMNAMQKEILEKDLKATRKLRKCSLLRTPYIDTVHLGLSQQEILEKRERIYYVSKDAQERMLLLLLLSRFSRVTQQTAVHQAPRPWDSLGKNTGVGCHFLLQCVKVKSLSRV